MTKIRNYYFRINVLKESRILRIRLVAHYSKHRIWPKF